MMVDRNQKTFCYGNHALRRADSQHVEASLLQGPCRQCHAQKPMSKWHHAIVVTLGTTSGTFTTRKQRGPFGVLGQMHQRTPGCLHRASSIRI